MPHTFPSANLLILYAMIAVSVLMSFTYDGMMGLICLIAGTIITIGCTDVDLKPDGDVS